MGAQGERLFNKYLHSARKMVFPKSKPSETSLIPMFTWNELNLNLIILVGLLFCLAAGFSVFAFSRPWAGLCIIFATLFMAASKDNYWLKSDVAAINREKEQRKAWLAADGSLLGVAILLIS